MSLFDNLTRVSNKTAEGLKAAQPTVAAVSGALNLLPAGGLKNWLTKDLTSFWKGIVRLIKGTRFQTGQYRLGERFIDQMFGQNVGYRDVSDDTVKQAQYFFTVVFGVRLNNDDDLWALDDGVDAYYSRPNKTDIPRAAVERAVRLKQRYYPRTTYNTGVVWDPIHWEQDPLVAPIPAVGLDDTREEVNVGKLFNGPLFGGATATEGIIDGDDAIDKLLNAMGWRYTNNQWRAPNPDGTPSGENTGGGNTTTAGMSTTALLLTGGLVIGGLVMANKKSSRTRKRRSR